MPDKKTIFDSFNVLECRRFVYRTEGRSRVRTVKDYEFDLHFAPGRSVHTDDNVYETEAGSCFFRRPGQVVYSDGDYHDCFLLTLDFSGAVKRLRGEKFTRSREGEQEPPSDIPLLAVIPPVSRPAHFADLHHILESLSLRVNAGEPDKNDCLLARRFLLLLASDALDEMCAERVSGEPLSGKRDEIVDACRYVEKNYSRRVTLAELAGHAGFTPNYFLRLFKSECGCTPGEYLIDTRLNNALSLLAENDSPVVTVAKQCGYNNASFFTLAFRDKFGMTPTEFRERSKKSGA